MASEGLEPILLALPSISPSLAVEVLPYGLTITRILVNGNGKTHDVVIGSDNPSDHKTTRGFINTIVGRYSNRIPVGDFTIEKDGLTSQLSIEATESPQVNLHGGADGFDRRVFEVVDPSDRTQYELFSEQEKDAIQTLPASAIFKLTSPAGDQGFPGRLNLEVLFGLAHPGSAPKSLESSEFEQGSVVILYRAKLDGAQEKTVTPVNLTQHWGFNLDASLTQAGEPIPDVKGHNLTIKAGNRIGLHPNGLATGELIPTPDTPYAHTGKVIGDRFPEKGYDEYYLFDSKHATRSRLPLSSLATLDIVNQLISASGDDSQATPVTLSSEKSGIRLTFETNQPGVQFYSGNFLNGAVPRKRIHGGSNGLVDDGYTARTAAFLEFHEPLAAWMHAWGQGGQDTLLTSDELYNNYTKLNVYVESA